MPRSPRAVDLKRAGVAPTEAQVSKAVRDYLAARRIFFLRINSGVVFMAGPGGKKYPVRLAPKGTSDILALPAVKRTDAVHIGARIEGLWHIVPLWIEVKGAGGSLTEEQAEFQADRKRDGHMVCIARSVEDVERVLRGMAALQDQALEGVSVSAEANH